MSYYFAYGSNMNPQRVADRGLRVRQARAGKLENMALRFNKRSRHNMQWGCANVAWCPGASVEGVLYSLVDSEQITRMDPFEGAPRYYSRERFAIHCEDQIVDAWVYIANPAVIDNSLKPLRWYLGQLLEGKAYLSLEYQQHLQQIECLDVEGSWG